MSATDTELSPSTTALLKRAGNPFRNYFARNPDDELCARFHVPELYDVERQQLLAVVDVYRTAPGTHSEMLPILGNKGAGKTHLLHSIKHGNGQQWQLLVTPGTYQKDTDFLEYLLFQVIDTLLGGGKQKGRRPLDSISEAMTRQLLVKGLSQSNRDEQMDLFPAPGLGRWTRRLGLGVSQAQERTAWLLDRLTEPNKDGVPMTSLRHLCVESSLDGELACLFLAKLDEKNESHDTTGVMRRQIHQGLARAALAGDESELANFLTYGFAELDFKVKPSRQVLVVALFKALMGVFQELRIPVVVAFDQLEDLLLARRNDDSQRTAEAFFAGIVQAMHQIDGICFLVFAERGLWNRFVPSLDGYIQDRLNNPVHVPGHGTLKAIRLEAPPADLVLRVAEARLRTVLCDLPDQVQSVYPFTYDQVQQIARTEPTLRDMLQQFRHLFDHLVYGEVQKTAYETSDSSPAPASRISTFVESTPTPSVKSVIVVESTSPPKTTVTTSAPPRSNTPAPTNLWETWDQEMATSRSNLETDGALIGATRELQAGLGTFLRICHEHGVKVGPWRLQHVVPEFTFGEHPTYGVMTIAHWACKDGQPWKVGIGLFLAKGPGKPKDLEIKLTSLDQTPAVIDHLILLRADDDLGLTGKSKTLWQDCEKKGQHPRLEGVGLEHFGVLYGFSRWLAALSESLPAGTPLPNLADLIQDRCEKLLEQVCMPLCP